jgi:hypothetical protein
MQSAIQNQDNFLPFYDTYSASFVCETRTGIIHIHALRYIHHFNNDLQQFNKYKNQYYLLKS